MIIYCLHLQVPCCAVQVLRYGAMSANIVTEEPIDMVLHESYAGKDTLW